MRSVWAFGWAIVWHIVWCKLATYDICCRASSATLFSLETKGEISEAARARRLRINFGSCCSAYALQRRWPSTAFEYCKKSCGIVFYSPRPSLESI
uniref:Putative secreted protein n=1 Tax=Anopheles triannulatus TaxID=58253 RepID=A0A2M4B4R9_9DIPT